MRLDIALNPDAPQAVCRRSLNISYKIHQTRHPPYAYGKLHPFDEYQMSSLL